MAGELQAIHDYEFEGRGHEECIDQRDIGIRLRRKNSMGADSGGPKDPN